MAKHVIDEAKEYGTTYRSFQMYDNTSMTMGVGSAYHPYATQNNRNNELEYGPSFRGNYLLDLPFTPGMSYYQTTTNDGYAGARYGVWGETNYGEETIASSQSYQLDLNVFRSGLQNYVIIHF